MSSTTFLHFKANDKSYSDLDDMSEDLVVSIFDENNDIEEDNVLMGKVIVLYFFIPYDAVSISKFSSFNYPQKTLYI